MPRDLVLKALYKSIVGNSEMSPMRSFVGILGSQMLGLFVMAVDNSGGGISLEKVGPRCGLLGFYILVPLPSAWFQIKCD